MIGKCRICGCTELAPCKLALSDGTLIACAWVDLGKTLCCNIHCVAEIPLAELERMNVNPAVFR